MTQMALRKQAGVRPRDIPCSANSIQQQVPREHVAGQAAVLANGKSIERPVTISYT